MNVLENRFGIRKHPSWLRQDFEAHVRLSNELTQALEFLRGRIIVNIPSEFTDISWNLEEYNALTKRERMYYFFDYALRLQRCYVFLLDAISPYCRVVINTNYAGKHSITIYLENKQYVCNYLNDHICCLTWVVGKINFHVQSRLQGKP